VADGERALGDSCGRLFRNLRQAGFFVLLGD